MKGRTASRLKLNFLVSSKSPAKVRGMVEILDLIHDVLKGTVTLENLDRRWSAIEVQFLDNETLYEDIYEAVLHLPAHLFKNAKDEKLWKQQYEYGVLNLYIVLLPRCESLPKNWISRRNDVLKLATDYSIESLTKAAKTIFKF